MYKIYTRGNILYVENVASGLLHEGHSKDVLLLRKKVSDTIFSFKNLSNWQASKVLDFSNDVELTGAPYSDWATFLDWIENELGKSSPQESGLTSRYSGYVNGWIGPLLSLITQDNATQISVSAGDFLKVDQSVPSDPSISKFTFAGVTGYTPINIGGASPVAYIYVSASTGLLVENLTPPKGHVPDLIYLGNIDFTTTTTQNDTVQGVNKFIETAYSTSQTQNRIMFSRGKYNLYGCIYGADIGLKVTHTEGAGVRLGANTLNDVSNPDVSITANGSINILVRGYVNSLGNVVNSLNFNREVDPTKKVINGTLVSLASQKYTVQYIYHFYGSDVAYVYYTNVEENTLEEAEARINQLGPLNAHPITSEAQLRAALVVRSGANDLTISADAKFIEL